MGIEIRFLANEKVLLVIISGKYVVSNKAESVKLIVAKLQEYNCLRCLMDHRESDTSADTMAIYSRPMLLEALGVDRSLKVARVFKEITEENQFYENVCQNRGWNFRTFTDYDTAMAWLLEA